jgi:G3E family GTPase
MTQIPFFLVTGFLGSGKTTFLKSALEKLPKKKVAIIQNEFAPASIDGTELKRQDGNYKTLEINNGSVFCVCLSKKTIRMKGFAKLTNNQCMAIQSSFDQYELKSIDRYNGPTEIIAIGDELDVSEFSRRYRELAK